MRRRRRMTRMARRLVYEELQDLASFLMRHLPSSCKLYGCALTALKRKFPLEFWVDQWPLVQTVVAKTLTNDQHSANTYSLFTVDSRTLGPLLEEPELVDWQSSRRLIFEAVPKSCVIILKEISSKHGHNLATENPHWIDLYYANKDTLMPVDLPPEVTCGELSAEHAQMISSVWKYSIGSQSIPYILHLMKEFPTYCLYNNERELIAFELTTYYGSVGVLYVTPEYRRKGYGSHVTSVLAQKVLIANGIVCAYIEQSNEDSIRLHTKLGFKQAPCETTVWVRSKSGI